MSAEPGDRGGRRIGSLALAIVGALLLLTGGILFYARETIFDSGEFAQRASVALDKEAVSNELAEALVDQLIKRADPELINARPLLVSVVEGVVRSSAFQSIFHQAVERTHRTLFTHDRDNLVLGLADATNLAIEGLQTVAPKVAAKIPKGVQPKLNELVQSDFAIGLVKVADRVRLLGIVLPLLGLVALAAAVLLDRDRRRGFLRVAISVAVAAGVGYLALFLVQRIATAHVDPQLNAAAKEVFDVYFGDLQKALLVSIVVAMVFAAAVGTRRRIDALEPLRRAATLVSSTPASSRRLAARAVLALAVGALLLLETRFALTVVGLAAGAYAVFFGLSELLALLAPPPERPAATRQWRSWLRPAAVTVLLLALIAAFLLLRSRGEGGARHPASIERCNGFAELCDRPINEVVFPGVHNAMSAARDGYLLANNEKGVTDQLDAGARALLIDAHWGIRGTHGVVITDLAAEGGKSKAREEAIASTSKEFVDAADKLVKRVNTDEAVGAEPQVFFCHVFCELGSTPGAALLTEVTQFLDSHPDEVVILFVEDYVSPQAMAAIFEQSGLLDYVYTPLPGEPLPTLRHLIATNQRAFVMSENEAGGSQYPWYQQGFKLTQETPYTFHNPGELAARSSCDQNRGAPGNPLFLLNNWVEAVPRSPTIAAQVNSRSFLLKRARMCARARNLLPNILAVDFWEHGDLFKVSERLNGLPDGEKPQYASTG